MTTSFAADGYNIWRVCLGVDGAPVDEAVFVGIKEGYDGILYDYCIRCIVCMTLRRIGDTSGI